MKNDTSGNSLRSSGALRVLIEAQHSFTKTRASETYFSPKLYSLSQISANHSERGGKRSAWKETVIFAEEFRANFQVKQRRCCMKYTRNRVEKLNCK